MLAGYVAWFEQLARSGAQSRRFTGGVAVIGGTSSNTDNGLAIDPSHVPGGELRDAIAWLRSANLPCSCVLTATAPVSVLQSLAVLQVVPDNQASVMGRSLIDYEPDHRPLDDLAVVEALSEDEVLDGLNALGDDWYEPQERQVRLRNDLAIGLGPASTTRHWVAKMDDSGAVVAMATSFQFDKTVFLLHCGVQPTYRRRSIGRALTTARLAAAAAAGATTAVLAPSPDGYQLHRQHGFQAMALPYDRWFHIR